MGYRVGDVGQQCCRVEADLQVVGGDSVVVVNVVGFCGFLGLTSGDCGGDCGCGWVRDRDVAG